MNFFGIGPMELLVVLMLALIVLGPRQLPEAGRKLGKLMGDLRQMWTEVSSELSRELNVSDAVDDIRAVTDTIDSIRHPPSPAALLLGENAASDSTTVAQPTATQPTATQEGRAQQKPRGAQGQAREDDQTGGA